MSLRVLVVDDEPLIASSVRAFLEDEGMEVKSVGSAEQALSLLRQECAFQVVIVDMRLPGMDGNAAIRAFNALCPGLRFIIHTGSPGYTLPDDLRALGLGEGNLFRKPVLDMEPLATTVRDLIRYP